MVKMIKEQINDIVNDNNALYDKIHANTNKIEALIKQYAEENLVGKVLLANINVCKINSITEVSRRYEHDDEYAVYMHVTLYYADSLSIEPYDTKIYMNSACEITTPNIMISEDLDICNRIEKAQIKMADTDGNSLRKFAKVAFIDDKGVISGGSVSGFDINKNLVEVTIKRKIRNKKVFVEPDRLKIMA